MTALQHPIPYHGEDLGPRPHVLLVSTDQIGHFVLATPLMRGLRDRFPDITLDYLGGEATRTLEEASPLIDARCSLFGSADALETLAGPESEGQQPRGETESSAPPMAVGPADLFLDTRRAAAGPYILTINSDLDPLATRACSLAEAAYVSGPYMDHEGGVVLPPPEGIDRLWRDTWNRPDLLADYPELHTQFIGEIFCRLARITTDCDRFEVPVQDPPAPVPPVLVATGAKRSARLWPPQHWAQVLGWCRESGLEVGLLGASPGQAGAYNAIDADRALVAAGAIDLRGALSLPEVAGALARAQAFVTIDSGLMHLAAAVNAPTIALFGASPRRLWAPPVPCVTILDPADPCTLCEENRFRNADCLLPVHQCMDSIAPSRVIAELKRLVHPAEMSL